MEPHPEPAAVTERDTMRDALIAGAGWSAAQRKPLAGDASNRKYDRLTDAHTGKSAVLMDAPPDKGEDISPFVAIADHLRGLGLSAPQIYAEDHDHGFLILEDLGDALFARVIPERPDLEKTLYEAATDVLISLRGASAPDLDRYGPRLMAELSALAFTKYAAVMTRDDLTPETQRFTSRFEDVLRGHVQGNEVLVMRDYHAENLIWLPEREGATRVGLLDFQDAMLGHPAYDLVSLLQDVRRDVPAGIALTMLNRYIAASGEDDHGFRSAYAVLGVQRNLRILGVFARLSLDYGKPSYVDLIPRVWSHLRRGLDHPAMAPIAELVLETLPPPTPENLARLKP